MRNRQVGPDNAADTLAAVVDATTYKPGWTLQLQELDRGQGCQGLTLCITATVPNSVADGVITFMHLMPVPPAAYDRDTWQRWVLDQVLLVEQHEALEWFKVDGASPYFPEHSPGRNPYSILQIKSHEQAHKPALPWNGGNATDPHFA